MTGLLACVLADASLRVVSPLTPLREVEDGVRELRSSDPETIVLGSSHARTFHHLGLVSRARAAAPRLVAIPLEGGKATGYQWLMAHRILPAIDARDREGRPVMRRVRRFVLVTEWWDSCADSSDWNIPARAWTWRDYIDDVKASGFTERNRNFLREQVRRALPWSVVVQRRGTGRILRDAYRTLRGDDRALTPAQYDDAVARWRRSVEQGVSCIGDDAQMEALRWVLRQAAERRLETHLVLFPRKPDTLTQRAKDTTLAQFAAAAQALADQEGATVVDLTTSTPLGSEHFMDDFDHLSPAGNDLFANWVLDQNLAFVGVPDAARPAGGAR